MQAQNLIPELALIEKLSPHWRSRFERALEYLFDRLEQIPPPSWDDVAAHCAISPQHFHRIFHSVFNEPPGQYLARIRLQESVYLLLSNDGGSVTEVAHATGFSSSQALAKALRRELGTNAKTIRKIGNDPKLEGLSELLERLGHPDVAGKDGGESLEVQMAKQLVFEIHTFPERQVKGQLMQAPSWEQLSELGLRQSSREMVMLTNFEGFDSATLNDFEMTVGVWADESTPINHSAVTTLIAGDYLCCTVSIDSEIAYFAVWEELDRHLVQQDLDVPEDGCSIEIIQDSSSMLSGISVVTFQILVIPASEAKSIAEQ